MGELKIVSGYATITDPDQAHPVERDTVCCGHCQRSIWVKPGTVATVYLQWNRERRAWDEVPGASCFVCYRPICLNCYSVGRCVPWERMLDISEGKDRLTRAVFAGFDAKTD